MEMLQDTGCSGVISRRDLVDEDNLPERPDGGSHD